MKRLLLFLLLSAAPLLAQSGITGGVRSTGTIVANDCVKFVSKNVITSAGAACAAGAGTVTSVSGTANQIVVANGTTTPVISVASTFTFPGIVTNDLSIFGATTSAQLAGIISNETGSGLLVFGTSPTLVAPALGTPTALVLTNATGLPLTTGVTGNLPVANLNSGTSASSSTFWRGDGTWAAAGAGTVTSVGESFTGGLISVAGSPVTTSGTLALTVAGTSGGIPYFDSATSWASSGVLSANRIVLGGGAAASPTVTAADTTTTHALFATAGAPAFRAIASSDIPSGTVTWDTIGAPAAGLSLAMGSNTSIFNTTTALSQMFAWKNTTAAVVGTSQGSPLLALCGRAFHGSADVEDCLTFKELPGNGNDAAITFTVGHTGTSTGVTTTALPGPVLVGTSGTASLPAYSFSGQTNLGFYSPAANQMAWAVGGNFIARVTNIGIGMRSDGNFTFCSDTSCNISVDSGISRDAAAVFDFGTSAAGNTSGRLKAAGYMSVGTTFTTDTGCGTVTSLTGGATAGSFIAQATGTCTVVITMGNTATAPNGWACNVSDRTTGNLFRQTASSTTTCTISGTAVTSDVISFNAIGY